MDGLVRWKVRVAPGEVTCLDCGETFNPRQWRGCPRCNQETAGALMRVTPTVPTTAYLLAGEYELI